MMIRLFASLLFLALFLSLPASAEEEWTIDDLQFSAQAQGDGITGSFDKIQSSIFIDFNNLDQSRAEVIIAIASLSIAKATQKEMLLGPDFFQADTHKKARFVSQSFSKIDDIRYAIQGILTIRGISRPIALPFNLQKDGTIQGRVNINRTWFGIGRGGWSSEAKINHTVQIRYHLSTT